MDEIKIHWTLTALTQRNSIFSYWNRKNRSNLYSIKLNKQILERLEIIRVNPFEGRLINVNNVRMSALGNFSVFYVYREGIVEIISFWDNRQNPDKLLDLL